MPFSRLYEIELAAHGRGQSGGRYVTRTSKAMLEPILGVGDAWSFVDEADRQWDAGGRGWAVEFEEE